MVADGDGELTYKEDTLNTHIVRRELNLNQRPEIEQARAAVVEREDQNRAAGRPAQWNDEMYALKEYARSRSELEESLELSLTFQISDYYTFQATMVALNKPLLTDPSTTLRERYLPDPEEDLGPYIDPDPFLAQGFGIAIIVFSEDYQELILSRRSSELGARRGELDVTYVEGVNPTDRKENRVAIDLYRTAMRGAYEEAGFDLLKDDITFLGFGVDTEYYQWNILGMARLRIPVEEAFETRRRGVSGRWETREFKIISSEPKKVFEVLRDEKMWATAWVTLYWALVQVYGRRKVERAADEVFGT